MTGDTGLKNGWKRLLVILCTLLLAGSVLLVFGVMGWAQDSENEAPQEDTGTEAETQEEGTETPAEEGQETGEEAEAVTTEQPPAEEEPAGEITIEYWEPQLGTRTVYYTNDFLNDIYGQKYQPRSSGYRDDYEMWVSTWDPVISIRWDFLNYGTSYYDSVQAVSDMNPVYFDLEGPWYFNMTTPWKVVEEVIGIHEAPDAHLFPYATYAKTKLIINSGGHREYIVEYMSNDANEQTWKTWGYTARFFPEGRDEPVKNVYYFRSPHDKSLSVAQTRRFPLMVGSTGSVEAIFETSDQGGDDNLFTGTYEVVAEGEITVPGGTYAALLIQYNMTNPVDGSTFISYEWFAKDIGVVVKTRSLPNIIGPTYGETTGYAKAGSGYFYTVEGILVLEEQTGAAGGEQQ